MTPVDRLGELLECDALAAYTDSSGWFTHRDDIKSILAVHLKTAPTTDWLAILEPAGIWCSDVFSWDQLFQHEGFKALNMTQHVARSNGAALETTRCPIRIDGALLTSSRGAPRVGEDTGSIQQEFDLSSIVCV
jgi:crotonobetainyl-CoA:carnitine CoA-transferase CaiB-like acyl-CoA transferase